MTEEILTETEVVRRVRGRDAEVRAWLRGLGIARRGPTGARVYLFSEVVAALPRYDGPVPVPKKSSTLRRSSKF